MENDRNERDESIVEGTLNDLLPGMGSMVKRLRKQSPEFNRKIEEKDAEITRRLEEGYSPEPEVRHSIRVRPLVPGGHKNTGKNTGQKAARPTIEPVTDLFDEGDYLRIIAELPGMTEDKILILVENTTLILSASDKVRNYRKEILLPCGVLVGKKRYVNGILELTLEKTDA
jgi:HSP20 family protein